MKTGAKGYQSKSETTSNLSDILKYLRSRIDPPSEAVDMGLEKPAIDPVELSPEDFSNVLKDFEAIFSEMKKKNDSSKVKDFLDQNKQLNMAHPANKIDAVWLYLVFSNYTFHWGSEKNKRMEDKIDRLKEFEKNNLDALGYILLDIEIDFNSISTKHYRNHQRLLMIQGYLQTFIRRQPELRNTMKKIPISFPREYLEISKKIAFDRKSGNASEIEKENNQKLFEALTVLSIPDTFKPLKNNPNDNYIDKLTSFELDFPLKGNITIETDGDKYHTNEFGRNDMVHTFKSAILTQSDWVRVSFSPALSVPRTNQPNQYKDPNLYDNNVMLRRVISLLQIPQLHRFHSKYQELLRLQRSIRDELDELQRKVFFSQGPLSDQEDQHFNNLVNADRKINDFISLKHIGSLLQEPTSIYQHSTREETVIFKNELMKNQSELNALNAKISFSHNALNGVDEEKEKNEKKLDALKEILKKTQQSSEAEISKLNKEKTKLLEKIQYERDRYEKYKVIYQTTNDEKKRMETEKFLEKMKQHIDKIEWELSDILDKVNGKQLNDTEVKKVLSEISELEKVIEKNSKQSSEQNTTFIKLIRNKEQKREQIKRSCERILPIDSLNTLITEATQDINKYRPQPPEPAPRRLVEGAERARLQQPPLYREKFGWKHSRGDDGRQGERRNSKNQSRSELAPRRPAEGVERAPRPYHREELSRKRPRDDGRKEERHNKRQRR